jgi:hypothetical protein
MTAPPLPLLQGVLVAHLQAALTASAVVAYFV